MPSPGWSVAIAIILVLHRLSLPHETVSRKPKTFPGLLICRFGAPLLFFNAPYFINRVQEIIERATPPVTFLLLNAEAMVEIDWEAVKALGELHYSLKSQGIELGICESKGYFAKALKESRLPLREGVNIYPSVAKALEDLKSKESTKKAGES